MSIKVCKFGGTSMATADSIRQVADIVKADASRRFVIVSAPGKRFADDLKITDQLYKCFDAVEKRGECACEFEAIKQRFSDLAKELNIKTDFEELYDEIEQDIIKSKQPDYAASTGEYLSALIFAEYTGFEFIDAKDIIAFDENGAFNAEYTNDLVSQKLKSIKGAAVIPGFYGSMPNGEIKTFSRGGSDVTGAIIARGINAEVYENWTDVSGFMVADPRIVENPKSIKYISYRELRELSYMGANVLHPDSIFPVKQAGIPINIKNTFKPEDEGTLICAEVVSHERLVTGIAGKKNFTSILIEKSMMNNEIGFARRVLSVLERHGMSIEHVPSGIDTLSVVIADSEIGNKMEKVLAGIRDAVSPDKIELQCNLSLIATVGHGMSFKPGTASRLFSALSRHGVNVRMIDQGSSEMNIIVAVANESYEKAINAIYEEFIN